MAAILMPALQLNVLTDTASTAVQARVLGRLLRGTPDGFLFESIDEGQTWRKIAKFGRHCTIVSIHERQGQAQAEIDVQGYRFAVRSADVRMWRTIS